MLDVMSLPARREGRGSRAAAQKEAPCRTGIQIKLVDRAEDIEGPFQVVHEFLMHHDFLNPQSLSFLGTSALHKVTRADNGMQVALWIQQGLAYGFNRSQASGRGACEHLRTSRELKLSQLSFGDVVVVEVLNDILAAGHEFQHELERVLVGICGNLLASYLGLGRREHVLDKQMEPVESTALEVARREHLL
jgi:hypothetical protein